MTVREMFEAARDAAIEIRRIHEQTESRREAIGVQGHGLEAHPKTGILDPMRKVLDLIAWEEQQVCDAELEKPIDEANELVVGMSTFEPPECVEIISRYYLQGESWVGIARGSRRRGISPISERIPLLDGREMDKQVELLEQLADAAIADCQEKGIPHLRKLAEGVLN